MIDILGLNVHSLLSKDLNMYVKTFFNELRKKSKCIT